MLDTQEVTGSIPVRPTNKGPGDGALPRLKLRKRNRVVGWNAERYYESTCQQYLLELGRRERIAHMDETGKAVTVRTISIDVLRVFRAGELIERVHDRVLWFRLRVDVDVQGTPPILSIRVGGLEPEGV